MRPSKSSRFDELKRKTLSSDEGDVATVERKPPSRRASVLNKRQDAVAAISSGRVKTVKVLKHDPARIRPWSGHNRQYEALSAERCTDLIDGFRRVGQQFAAVVRVVNDSDDFDYEFICGARRHWTAVYLKIDLLIEVRDLEDRDAFLLQDVENRDREDISDYERACDYMQALPIYFNGVKSHMAEQLQIDQGNFSRFLALADLPKDIVVAYGDIRDLIVHHGAVYTTLMKDPDAKKRMLAACKKLKGQGADGRVVMATLKKAAESGAAVNTSSERSARYGDLSVKTGRGGQVSVSFKVPKLSDKEGIESLKSNFEKMLDQMMKSKEAS